MAGCSPRLVAGLNVIRTDPKRDPRFHTVSAVYICRAEILPTAGDDAKSTKVISLNKLEEELFVFDHGKIIRDYLLERRT